MTIVRKTMFTFAAMSLMVFVVAPASGALSSFDVDDEGWTIAGDAQGASVLPDYHATGGNPGGYISATDNVQGGVWYYKAPEKFRGDFQSGYGTNLTFDLRQSSLSSQFNAVDVYLRGGGLELTFDTPNNPGTNWTPYSIGLTESSGWLLSGVAPTQPEMLQVLGNVTDVQIRGEFVTGSDVGSLDNVTMVPEPATLALLLVGGLALLRRT